MQYALMIYADPSYQETASDAEREAVQADYLALMDDARGVAGARLQPAETARCVRVVGGRTLMTDGPFADTKEVLGGFCVIEAANLDEVIEFAERIPAARVGGVVEIRPVMPR
ncbi:MAG TPA: YciI family protein [Mycobacteriales bacterium]|nr:YciI family protein [Mycobacteriales bacterium]